MLKKNFFFKVEKLNTPKFRLYNNSKNFANFITNIIIICIKFIAEFCGVLKNCALAKLVE